MTNQNQQKLIDELSGILDRAVEIVKEIKGYSSANHKWVKKAGSGFRGDEREWWHCEKCLLTPTMVKPDRANEDKPLESPCPGPALYSDEP